MVSKTFLPRNIGPHTKKSTKEKAFVGPHRCDSTVVKKAMAASLTIVTLTDLAGDEIWTEEAWRCGHCQKGYFWLTDHPEFKQQMLPFLG